MLDSPVGPPEALIDSIYAAVEDTSQWNVFLDAFRASMKMTMASLFMTSLDSSIDPTFTVQRGMPEPVLELMARNDFHDPWLSRVNMATVAPGQILRSNEICPDEILLQDQYYLRGCLPNNLHYGGGVIVENSPVRIAAMSCIRSRSAGPLTDDEIRFWQTLVPHVSRAVRLIGMRTKLSGERDALMQYFDDVGQGMILTNAERFVLAMNASAKRLTDKSGGLQISGGRLVVDEESRAAFQEALTQADVSPSPGAARILLKCEGEPLLATILPVRHKDGAQVSAHAPTAVIYLVDPVASVHFDTAPLQLLFRFTAAEARLACRLASGCSLTEAANDLGVSLNTVRTHLQRALAKAGLNRQAELVAVVLRTSRSV